MKGLIKRTTSNYNLRIPNFDVYGWGREMERNLDILDASLFAATSLGGITGVWANGTSYDVADRVVDPTDNSIWQCQITHTSPATGTFTQARAANPTYWEAVTQTFNYRGEWATATNYVINDIVYLGYVWALAKTTFTSGASLSQDILDGNFVVLLDGTQIINDATTAKSAAEAAEQRVEDIVASLETMAGFRNKLINSGIEIWQRPYPITIAAGQSVYTADRWLVFNTTDQSCTVSPFIFPNGTPYKAALMAVFNTAPTTGDLFYIQRIEGAKTFAGEVVTFTTMVALPYSGPMAFSFNRKLNASTTEADLVVANKPVFVSNGNFIRQSAVIQVPAITDAGTNLANDYLEAVTKLTPREVGAYAITHASIVAGDATSEDDPSSPRHIQQELALCQRYYEKSYPQASAPGSITSSGRVQFNQAGNDYYAGASVEFKVSKRTEAPSITIYSPATGASARMRGLKGGVDVPVTAECVGSSGFVAQVLNTFMTDEALAFHFTADAEL